LFAARKARVGQMQRLALVEGDAKELGRERGEGRVDLDIVDQ
jgi:hypothetical protein